MINKGWLLNPMSTLGLRPFASRFEAIASRLEAIASRFEAIASTLEAIASRFAGQRLVGWRLSLVGLKPFASNSLKPTSEWPQTY